MRRFTALITIALLTACQGSGETEGAVKQYRAWCWSESKPLGDWTTDKAAAQAQVDAHTKMIPHHRAAVKVWTGPLQSSGK